VLQLTRLSGPIFALNPDLIERAEATPDTVVTLVNGSKYVILETLEELIELIHAYRVGLVTAAQASGGFAPTSSYSDHAPVRPTSTRRDTGSAKVVALHPGED
jgi:flagellar protein FlbD